VEDTAFYRYVPLLAVNEVGGAPETAGGGVGPFHAHNAHIATRWPQTMLTLSTHDTKRSADVRARLSLLSEIPTAWRGAVDAWMDHNGRHRRDGWPDVATELVLYQTVVGAWPVEADRVEAAMLKSMREAKVHTSWRRPDAAYEEAVLGFVGEVLADARFLALVERFLEQHDLVRLGRVTSLAQVTLLLTCPGIPDVYQGDELWDLSLVDPDNRRPVDFAARAALLDEVQDLGALDRRSPDGAAKLGLIHRLLDHRRRRPEACAGVYEPLEPRGSGSAHAVTFRRDELVVVVPRLVLALERAGWGDTSITLPEGSWTSVLDDGEEHHGCVRVADLMGAWPVAVLERLPR